MTIFLSGFMGCGKTTVGIILAEKLGYEYLDSDELIVEQEGMTIPEIFAEKGEPYFRKVEAEIIKSLCGREAVVACGGGAMLNDGTADFAKNSGKVVYLDVPFNICYERICGDTNRPIVMSSTKDELYERYKNRKPVYIKNSTVQVRCTSSPTECAKEIMESLC